MAVTRVPLRNFVKEYSVRNKNNEEIPVYSVTNSQGFCTEYFGKEVASQDKTTYKIVPKGYFAYNPSRINVGSVDWQRTEERVIVSPLYNVFSVTDEIDRQYLYYFLKSNIGRQMIKAKASGSVRDNLKLEMLKEMTIPDISVTQQSFEASVLDRLQLLIQLRQKELQQLDELIKARFVEMFGDPIKNSRSLKIKRLEELGTWNSGGTPSRTKPEYFTGDINWYSAGELNSLYLHGSIEKITSEAIEESTAKLFKAGSMLVGMYDTAAFKMGILEEDSASNQACACIEPKESVNIVWLYYALSLMKEHYLSQRRGVRQKNLNLGMIRGFELPVAEKTDQDEFGTFVKQVVKSKVIGRALDFKPTLLLHLAA